MSKRLPSAWASTVSLAGALLLLAAIPCAASKIQVSVTFELDDLRIVETERGTRVSMRGASRAAAQEGGELPLAIRTFFIPEGMEVRAVRATPREEIAIASGVRLAKREGEAAIEFEAPAHPEVSALSLGGGTCAGFRLHSVALFPVRFERAGGDLVFHRALDVELELMPSSEAKGIGRLRVNEQAERALREALSGVVVNAGDLPEAPPLESQRPSGVFSPHDLPSVEGSAVDMVILTTTALESSFQPLASWKTRKGVATVIRTVEWIETNYPAGHDQPEKVRQFLQDAYSKWGTFLVLVGGDFEELTPRLAYNVFFFGGELIPTDQYWACLDGDWNADGDSNYGEGDFLGTIGDDADLYPDLFLGRAPVATPSEVATFVNKSLTYERAPPLDYIEDVCHFSEVLFPEDWVYGDPVEDISLDGVELTTDLDQRIDPAWTRQNCFQSANMLSRSHALTHLNLGHHLLTLVNHGDAFKFSVGNGLNPLIFIADTGSLTNGDRLSVVLATACNPNQFDLESCGESLMNNPNGGAIVVIGPTRVDFPVSAAQFHDEMLRIMFAQGVTRFGAATQVNRIPFLPFASTDQTQVRWTVLSKLLLGDPEIRLWTERPRPLVVTHAASVPLGTATITVTVTDTTSTPVSGALVCMSDESGTYSRGRTSPSGVATLELASSSSGTADVVVTMPEFLPHEGVLTIQPTAAPLLAVTSVTFDDDDAGLSNGNGNGVIEAGETIELSLDVFNGGGASAANVLVTSSVEPGSSATFDLAYKGVADTALVFVGPNRLNPPAIPFTLGFSAPTLPFVGAPTLTWAADSTADRGIFLWQDASGWHLWWSSQAESVQVAGTVTTDGSLRALASLELEPGSDWAAISSGNDSLTFRGTTSPTDGFDTLDFALADSTSVTVTSASDALGSIAAAATANATVAFTVAGDVAAERIAYVDLTITSSSGGPWKSEVPVVFAGPALEAYLIAVDDTPNPPATNGNGNHIIELGEKVRVTPTVLNRGTGAAEAVTGAMTAGGGITFQDASDAFGSIAPLAQSTGTNGYVFTVASPAGTSVVLTLSDSLGRTWVKTIEFAVPEAPTALAFTSNSGDITLVWVKPAAADLAGYNVYRSATPGTGFARSNFELLRSAPRYVDEGLAVGSRFYYKVAAVDSSGNEGAASGELFAWTTQPQVGGWPQQAGGNVFGSIAIDDGDGDGRNELYLGSMDFGFYGWDEGGSLRPGFPVHANGQIWSTPALADIDEDGDLEMFWGANDSRFYAVHHDGSPLYGSTSHMIDLAGTGSLIRSSATVADVDKDSDLEFFFGTDSGRIYAFKRDGTPLAGGTGLLFTAPPGNSQARIWGPIAIADIAGDGNRRIVFASWNDSLYVLDANGAVRPGFPRRTGADIQTGPSIGDLDADGTMEILVGSNDGGLYAFNHDGTNYLSGGILATLPDDIRGVPAICNLDADPELEVVTGCLDGRLYAFNHDGSGFLQPSGLFADIDATNDIFASPIVVDVDGDDDFEIFIGHLNGKFYGYHHDGSLMAGMPIPTNGPIFATAAAGDLDSDGGVDVAFVSYDQTVNVIDFPGVSDLDAYEWPTYAGNNFRTSVYGEAGPYQTGTDPILETTFAFGLSQNTPNPFFTETWIRCVAPKPAPVRLRVYDVSGRLVRTLLEGPVAAGRHVIRWDGRDDRGSLVSSGMYLYRLESDGESLTRKSILLR